MLDRLKLPTLTQFKGVLKSFNLKKSYEYLIYFAKNQERLYTFMPQLATPDLKPEHVPSANDRDFIIKRLSEILLLEEGVSWRTGPNGKNEADEVLIMSCQRFIMGLIMLGHVHIYEILIREFMPVMLKIIQLHKSADQQKQEIQKKIKHFCRETITLLSIWFPKSFYDNSTASWFKKAVAKYDITVKFVVYFSNDKIESYEKTIKQLRLNDSKSECAQCKHCLEMSGKNYVFLRNIPDLPSTIEEDQNEHEAGTRSLSKNAKKKTFNQSEISHSTKRRTESHSNHMDLNTENADQLSSQFSDKKNPSSLSQRIRRHRQARNGKSNGSLMKESLRSRLQYYNSESRLQSQKQEESELKQKKGRSTGGYSKSLTSENQEQSRHFTNKSIQNSNTNTSPNIAASSSGKLSRVQSNYLSYKGRQKDKYKYFNKPHDIGIKGKQITTEKILPSEDLGREDYYEIGVKKFETKKQIFQEHFSLTNLEKNRALFTSVFQPQLYRNLRNAEQKIFRKECFELVNKKITNKEKQWNLLIKCKPKSRRMEVKIDLICEDPNNSVALVQPKHPELLIKEGRRIFFFNFQKGFLPIILRIEDEQILIPITLVSMLEPVEKKRETQEMEQQMMEIYNSSQYIPSEVVIKLDTELFKDIHEVASLLKFGQQDIFGNRRIKKFLFFGQVILITMEAGKSQDDISIKINHRQSDNDEKIFLLLREVKKCLEKQSDPLGKKIRRIKNKVSTS